MKAKYLFSGQTKITATFISGNYIWVAFEGISSVCDLYKSSVFNPNLRYWNVDVTADIINSMIEDSTYLYLATNHVTYIGAKVNKTTPTSITYFTKDATLTEEAIDLIDDATYAYFLTPGNESGVNAKIGKYNKSTRAFVETIDLTTVTNAKKIDIDNAGVIWVQSDLDTSVPKLTKVWYDGSWNFTTYNLT